MKLDLTDCITVLGTRGTGKSTLARKIAKMWPRSIVLGPVQDWTDGEIITSFKALGQRLSKLNKENAKEFRIIFRFNPDSDQTESIFDEILRLAYHFGNLQVVIDEIQLFSSPQFIPKYLKNLLFIGRHKGVSVLCITQRPGQLNKSILSQSRHVFIGQLHEQNDLNVIAKFANMDQQQIINLAKFSFFHFSPGEKMNLIKLPKK